MSDEDPNIVDYIKALFFYVPESVNPIAIGLRALLFIGLAIWGALFIFHSPFSNYAGESFLHNANLIFHEAGHIIFRLLGDFMGVLGGSLCQILIPLIAAATLLLKTRDTFGAAVGLWWVGENFIDLAPYINDARDMNLLLLGGITGQDSPDYHDWQNLLYRLNLLQYDHALANFAQFFGSFLIVLALAWMAYILFRQYQNRES
jgi:hypothetical protein